MKTCYKFLLIFSLLFMSCKSTAGLVPGQKQIVVKNLYKEYLNIADTYYSMEKYDKAITYYTNCLNDKSLYNTAYYKLGLCYVKSSDWNNAENVFQTLLKKDPENATLKSSLAYVYCMNNSTEKAGKIYVQLLEQFPENSLYLENYIAVLLKEKKYDESAVQLEILKNKFPDSTKIAKIEEEIKKQTEEQSAEKSN